MFDAFLRDAVAGGETPFEYGTCEVAQRLLTRFNWEIKPVIEEHGLDNVGTAIWYVYGCTSGMTHDVLDESVASGFAEFYQSLECLYENGFAKHCKDAAGHSDTGGDFATACYMLWDMDGGLEYLSFHGSERRLELVERLIDFGLRHRHAAVQESFLHCLGHRQDEMPEFVAPKLAAFLDRSDLSQGIRTYAKQCRTGMIL